MPIAQKWYILELWLLLNSNKKPRARSQTMAISSGQNVIEAKKLTLSISHKPTDTEPWLLLNVNKKSKAAYYLLWSSASPNHQKGLKWPLAGAHHFTAIRMIPPVILNTRIANIPVVDAFRYS